jgi:hypothetical protein
MLAMAKIWKTLLLAATVLAAALPTPTWAAQSAGTIKILTGEATVTRDAAVLPAAIGQRIYPGDRIAMANAGYLGIVFRDDTRITLGPNGEFLVREFDFDASSYAGSFVASFLKGTMRVVTGIIAKHTPDRVKFDTATSTIGVRGTDFIVDLGGQK